MGRGRRCGVPQNQCVLPDHDWHQGVNTYKFEVQYAPVDDFRVRAGYQRAIRAPNIVELFTPQSFGTISAPSIDPCAPTRDPVTGVLTPATATLAQCQHTGVTAAQYGNGGTTNSIPQCTALQCAQLMGGNIALKPEKSDSITIGVNITPRALPNLSASIDYYRIKLTDTVGTISATIILQNCLATGDPTYCQLISRTAAGSIAGSSVTTGGYITQTSLNVGAAKVEGIDVQTSYKAPVGERFGTLVFNLSGSALLKNKTTPIPGAPTYDCAGLYGPTCLTVNPRWRHNLRMTWVSPWDVQVSAYWRYIGQVSLDSNSSDPSLSNGNVDAFDATMKAQNYFDLSAAWRPTKVLELRAGVNNLFDRDPPVVSANVVTSGAANSIPVYDQLGRQLFIAFTAKY